MAWLSRDSRRTIRTSHDALLREGGLGPYVYLPHEAVELQELVVLERAALIEVEAAEDLRDVPGEIRL